MQALPGCAWLRWLLGQTGGVSVMHHHPLNNVQEGAGDLMYRAIPVHVFFHIFLYRGSEGHLRIEIGSKKCTGGGASPPEDWYNVHRGGRPLPGTFFFPNLAKIVQGGGATYPPL